MSYDYLVLCYHVYAFCLRTSKDPSVREFDETIISLFYIIINLVLFRFKFILYYCCFLIELFTLRFNKLYFRNEYWVEQSWSKRKRIRSWFGLEKMQDSTQKYAAPKSEAWHGPCQMWHGRAISQDSILLLLLGF